MPELPEVEVVRAGLEPHVVGRRIAAATVHSARTARRYEPGPAAMAAGLVGRIVTGVGRRGKYLWITLSGGGDPSALVVHLGMSGQMLVRGPAPAGATAPSAHLRADLELTADDEEADARPVHVEFVDQRTFGWWLPAPFVRVDGTDVPAPVAHIARDPMDPRFDPAAVVRVLKTKHTEVKRLMLDQTVVSGIGNIYADEALWRAGVHGGRAADSLSRPVLTRIVESAREVMADALAQGGTSFDALYVDVNGQSGYFSRSLNVYGRGDEPCVRCGAPIRRERFMNRSSYSCPRCQVRPRYALR